MSCPLCSNDSVSAAARLRETETTRSSAERLASEVLSMAQAVRDISSKLRHKTADTETADMLDDLARRMAAKTTQVLSRG